MTRFLGLFTLLLSLFIANTSTAQTVTIGTETNLGSDATGSLPINPYYGFSYSQTIYLAEDIDATGNITAIKYHFNGTSLTNSRVMKIYMCTTNEASFRFGIQSWIPPTAFTLVFDGIIDSVSGDTWVRIPLTTPFAYTGEENLVIAVDENNPDYDGENDKFYYSNALDSTEYRSLFFISDDYNPNPDGPKPSGLLTPAYANIQLEGLAFNCKKPKTPSVFDITGTMAMAAWTAPTIGPTVTNYTWKVVNSSATVDAAAVSTGTGVATTATITALTRGLSYDFYVKTTCSDHNVNRWVGPVSFTAGCSPTTNFPFAEDFETTTGEGFASCWTEMDTLPNGKHWHTETGKGNNSNRAAVVEASSYEDIWLVLPPITLNGNQRLRYAARIGFPGESYTPAKYDVRISTTGKQPDDFTTAVTDTMSVNFGEYRDTSHSLAAYSGNVYIAIHTTRAEIEYANELHIDDIVVENIPTCLEPTKLVTADVTADSATLSWASDGNTTGKWQIYYGYTDTLNPPYSQDSLLGKMVIANSNPFVLRGLEQYANYTWWVRRVCGVSDTSRWSNPTSFRTPAACGVPTNIILATDSTNARVSWSSNKKPIRWTLYYGPADITRAPYEFNGSFAIAREKTFTLHNLEYPKLYSLWVVSQCDTIDNTSPTAFSDWSPKIPLQTYVKNDFCTSATPIAVDTNYTTALTHPTPMYLGGEGKVDNVCNATPYDYLENKDIWYKFVAPADNKRLIIRTLSQDAQNKWLVAIYDSCNGEPIHCATDNFPNGQTNIELCPYQYTANATYYVRVFPQTLRPIVSNQLVIYADTTTCPNVPKNDICANATFFARGDTIESTTFLATSQTNALPSCEDPSANLYDVWFKFSSGSGANRILNTDVIFENTDRGFYNMTIYKGSCGGLNEISAFPLGDCVFTTNNIERRFINLMGLEENRDYYVRVWSTTEGEQRKFNIYMENVTLRDSAFVNYASTLGVCDTVSTVVIDSTNNNRWVPIMGYMDIVAEIKANGQNLGEVKTSLFGGSPIDSLRTFDGQPYVNRNLRLSASKPFAAPIQMRFYMAGLEWDSLKSYDINVNDTTFRVVRMVGDTSCKTDVDPTGFTLARMTDAKLKKLDQDYCIEYTTSALGHFFVTTIPKTTIVYPNTHVCPSETAQKDSLTGASGGIYTALPVGLSINATTGTVNPTASTAGLYTVSYAIPDLYGGGVATTTIKIDTITQIIAQPPTRRVLTVGTPITLSVGGVGENLTYQWRKDSVNILNATNKTFVIPATSMTDTGVYSVVLTGSCGSTTSINTTVSSDNGVIVSAKVFLQGAFNTATGLMNDNLRTLNVLPTVEPYSNLATFTQVKGNKNATATPSVLAASDNTAVVDWMFLELRSSADPSVIVATQSVLVRRDGVVVDAEGNAAIYFGDVPQGNYYIAVRHRNHFGIRTANALNLVKGVATAFDFTTPTANIYVNPSITSNPPTKIITVAGVDYRTLWTGDINQDGFIKYNGSRNDRSAVLLKVGGVLTNTSSGYSSEDVNLNGLIKYSGSLNDRSVLLLNVGSILTNVLKQHL